MFSFLVLFAILAMAAAFAPAARTGASMRLFKNPQSQPGDERKIDSNGRWPGDAGYQRTQAEPPKDFAAYKAEQAAKKAAAEAGK
ncbi:hypothetical protein B484DRAFT_442851 [Ochromonadaceae sp. CCMP2298]|nr:hypothetical protein B484DRAFT_442851 [Ochromonadaceae sp. CCMP2298]